MFLHPYPFWHYSDVIMRTMTSQITSLTIVYSTVYSGANQRKHQSSASLAFVRGIHLWPMNSPYKGPVTRKMFIFDDVIMRLWCCPCPIRWRWQIMQIEDQFTGSELRFGWGLKSQTLNLVTVKGLWWKLGWVWHPRERVGQGLKSSIRSWVYMLEDRDWNWFGVGTSGGRRDADYHPEFGVGW